MKKKTTCTTAVQSNLDVGPSSYFKTTLILCYIVFEIIDCTYFKFFSSFDPTRVYINRISKNKRSVIVYRGACLYSIFFIRF